MKQLRIVDYGLPVTILGLAIAGARLQNVWSLYAMLALICVYVGLVSFGKVSEKAYPLALFAIGLALLYQTTLIGPGLVGTDIHGEYYFYQKALNGWDTSIPNAYNTSIGSTVIAPFLTNTFHIPGYWVYKAVFPFFFAFVPVLLYFVFKREFGGKIAFLSVFFFVSMLSWSLEMISLPRQMLAELMFALILFIIMVSKLRFRYKIPLLVVCAVLGMMFHYATGPLILFYVGCAFVFLLFSKRRVFPLKWIGLCAIVLVTTLVGYYGSVASGEALSNIVSSAANRLDAVSPFTPETDKVPIELIPPFIVEPEQIQQPATVVGETPVAPTTSTPPTPSYLWSQERLVRTALGMDFMGATVLGKIFRVLQYLTQLCIVLGCIYLVKIRKRVSAEYLSFAVASVILIIACLFWPRLSNMVNVTRLYHISLFLLAPACVIGGALIFKKTQVLVLCLLVPYFIFTSGFVFEVSRQEDVSKVDIPYSIALSNSRVDLTEIPTANDIAVRDWAVSQNLGRMLSDAHGGLLFYEKVWYDWDLKPEDFKIKMGSGDFKTGDYIFLSERNNRTGTFTFLPTEGGATSGTRRSTSFSDLGFDKVIENSNVIYQQGDAMILEVR